MIDYSSVTRALEHVYFEYFLGLDKKKEKNLEQTFRGEQTTVLEEYNLPESYWIDRHLSLEINTEVLQQLIKKLKECIDINNPFAIDFDIMSKHPMEARFFFRVYNRKFDEYGKKFVQINPFSEKSKAYYEWERARLLTGKPPVFEGYKKEYNAWKQNVMRYTYTYLFGALELDLKKRCENGNLLLRFTYVTDKEKELRKRMFISASKTTVALGIIYGLGFVYKRFIKDMITDYFIKTFFSMLDKEGNVNNEGALLV